MVGVESLQKNLMAVKGAIKSIPKRVREIPLRSRQIALVSFILAISVISLILLLRDDSQEDQAVIVYFGRETDLDGLADDGGIYGEKDGFVYGWSAGEGRALDDSGGSIELYAGRANSWSMEMEPGTYRVSLEYKYRNGGRGLMLENQIIEVEKNREGKEVFESELEVNDGLLDLTFFDMEGSLTLYSIKIAGVE